MTDAPPGLSAGVPKPPPGPPPRSTLRTLLSGGGWSAFTQFAPLLINIALTPYVIHGFGLSRYGVFLLTTAIVSFLSSFDGGLGNTSARFLTVLAGRGDKVESTKLIFTVGAVILTVATPLTAALWLLATPISHLAHMPEALRSEAVFLFRVMAALVALGTLRSVLNSAIYAHQRFAFVSLLDTGVYGIYVVGILLSVSQHWGLRGVAFTFLVMQGISIVGVLPVLRPYLTRSGLHFLRRAELREFFGYAGKIQVVGISALVNNEVASLLIAALRPVREVGLYQAGASFATQVGGIPWNGLLPMTTVLGNTLGQHGRERLDEQFGRLQHRWVQAGTGWAAAALGAVWFGITAWLGPRFNISGTVAVIIFFGGCFHLLSGSLYVYLQVVGLPGIGVRFAIASMVTNIVLLIPLAFTGIVGIAVASGSAGVVATIYLQRLVRDHPDLSVPSLFGEIPLVEGACTLAVCVGLELLIRPLVPRGPAGLLISALPAGVSLLVYTVLLVGPRQAGETLRRLPQVLPLSPDPVRSVNQSPGERPLRLGVVFENTVGHVTFAQTLCDVMSARPDVEPVFLPISVPPRGLLDRLDLMKHNWSLNASLHTRVAWLRGAGRELDAVLFHTQTTTLLSVGFMRRVPSVVSLDATPRNFDEVAAGYGHQVGSSRAEELKLRLVRRPLHAARALVAWSEWVRASLVSDYDVDPARIEVIPAGTNTRRHAVRPAERPSGPPRVLFVGGAFRRKGGEHLLAAVRQLDLPVELDIITQEDVDDPPPGVRVHRGLNPGDPAIDALYSRADVFVLPTTADASPHVVLEAMAAGLPVITTCVGAIPEVVREGETGLLLSPGDDAALTLALRRLCADPDGARVMGAQARAHALEHFDSWKNVERVLELMRQVARPTP